MKIKRKIITFMVLFTVFCARGSLVGAAEKNEVKNQNKESSKPPESELQEASSPAPQEKEREAIKSYLLLSGPVIASPLEVYLKEFFLETEAAAEKKE